MELNFFPIKFGFDIYQIISEPYTETRLNELRKEFIGNADIVLGILGYSLATGLFAIFRKKVEILILSVFGYNKKNNQLLK
jgi:hypothetical protein